MTNLPKNRLRQAAAGFVQRGPRGPAMGGTPPHLEHNGLVLPDGSPAPPTVDAQFRGCQQGCVEEVLRVAKFPEIARWTEQMRAENAALEAAGTLEDGHMNVLRCMEAVTRWKAEADAMFRVSGEKETGVDASGDAPTD